MKIFYLLFIVALISLVAPKRILKNLGGKKENKVIKLAEDDNLENIRKNALMKHNFYRKKHQVGDLVRNSEIEAIAQAYSKKLSSVKGTGHSGNTYNNSPLGENLYYVWGSYQMTVTGADATESWYNEVSKYDFNNPGFTSGIGHFTQLVWKGSKELGCGASCENNYCAVTCNYFPAGNYLGEFASNVFPAVE